METTQFTLRGFGNGDRFFRRVTSAFKRYDIMCGMCGIVRELSLDSKWTHLSNDRLLLDSLPGWLGVPHILEHINSREKDWLTLTGIICPDCKDAYLVAREYGQ